MHQPRGHQQGAELLQPTALQRTLQGMANSGTFPIPNPNHSPNFVLEVSKLMYLFFSFTFRRSLEVNLLKHIRVTITCLKQFNCKSFLTEISGNPTSWVYYSKGACFLVVRQGKICNQGKNVLLE